MLALIARLARMSGGDGGVFNSGLSQKVGRQLECSGGMKTFLVPPLLEVFLAAGPHTFIWSIPCIPRRVDVVV